MIKKSIPYLILLQLSFFLGIAPSCTGTSNQEDKKTEAQELSESDFRSVPNSAKPWVYYWWLKGNVSKELITRDLEEMKDKGIGGILLFDSRGYHDGYEDGIIPVPLNIKYEFMSPEWREMVKFTMHEANRLGLEISVNIANSGGLLRGPWDMGEQGPKQLIWTTGLVTGPAKIDIQLKAPADIKYFKEVAVMAVPVKQIEGSTDGKVEIDLNKNWKNKPDEKSRIMGKTLDLSTKINEGKLQWDAPEGQWQIVRFAQQVIGETGTVDILNSDAVTDYFHLMGEEILKDAGPLAGTTLTHFYNVSWEGGQPNWTTGFEDDFKRFRGYDIHQYMPMLAGMIAEDSLIYKRFLHDYYRTVSDCFEKNCYQTIGKLCHDRGIKWHSENGGPWPREAPMFREADQLTYWGNNDMPQGEFWNSKMSDLHTKSNMRFTAMAAHIYGHRLVSVEAFTHMADHWSKYPGYLKPFADVNLIDGSNFFIWHTFTASPLEIGKPGYEYFAGTHLNPNVTWWDEVGPFMDYLGRCQYLLRKGLFVADVCAYVSDKNYVEWGRGKKWNENSNLFLDNSFTYDLLDTKALVDRLQVKNGRLVLPDGMSYRLLVLDLLENQIPLEALEKIMKLANDGATIVLGNTKPTSASGLQNFPDGDKRILEITNELWGDNTDGMHVRPYGKGKIYTGANMKSVIDAENIPPHFEGPFEYTHRNTANEDFYFISGEGKAECTFRVVGKKPEIWDPLNGMVSEAISYRFTKDGRTVVQIDLPKDGSTFIVFREPANLTHLVSIEGPGEAEIIDKAENSVKLNLWQSGEYNFNISNGNDATTEISVIPPVTFTGIWDVDFVPEVGSPFTASFPDLVLWNQHPDPDIKYFAGTATYKKTVSLTAAQAGSPARLNLGNVHNISRVRVNGKDLGIICTAPWKVDITGVLKETRNEIEIEVTNCWANRLIGDAGLEPEKRLTQTNVRLVPNRNEYPKVVQAISASDPLFPSGLSGPVLVEFGQNYTIMF